MRITVTMSVDPGGQPCVLDVKGCSDALRFQVWDAAYKARSWAWTANGVVPTVNDPAFPHKALRKGIKVIAI